MPRHQPLFDAILNGDSKGASQLTKDALASGADPEDLVSDSMIPAMDEVGRRFDAEEFFVPELIIAGRAMKAALEVARPFLSQENSRSLGRVVIGTVSGDLHDIGKNLVASLLEGAGFEVIDLGANVPPERFVACVKESGARIVALSALLTTTMPAMKTTIDALRSGGVRDQVKVLVGGAPVTENFAAQIGADAYGANARSAVVEARSVTGV